MISKKLEEATGIETRSCVLGHIQRGGSPCAYDRILGVRFGSYAVELVEKRKFSCMVALRGTQMTAVPIEEAVKTLKLVDPDCQLVRTARDPGRMLRGLTFPRLQANNAASCGVDCFSTVSWNQDTVIFCGSTPYSLGPGELLSSIMDRKRMENRSIRLEAIPR